MTQLAGGRTDGEDPGRGTTAVEIGPRCGTDYTVGPHLQDDLPDMAPAIYGCMVVSVCPSHSC